MEYEYLKELNNIINTFLNLAETLLRDGVIDTKTYMDITNKKKEFLRDIKNIRK
ncbi:hypothetical protein NSA47_04215 [Irregularibacter muris]|uniref:Uncharacterized protein n=1 Tax=Irregularibacter muris TaxID=1796619 RepID=A0AAE3HET7_9FIRM|nr:hypothetical protein [Irregularibacter muris]MCR1898192.1 hypothetical protein [Irregularibacter muris]